MKQINMKLISQIITSICCVFLVFSCNNTTKNQDPNKTHIVENDSIKLVATIQNREIEIAEKVFGDCIYSYLQNDCKKEALSYPKNIVEKNRNSIFNRAFFKKVEQNEFSLFSEYVDEQKCYCISISENKEGEEFSTIYWFQKINGQFYFIGLTCVG